MEYLKRNQKRMLAPIVVDHTSTPSLFPHDDDIIELLRCNEFDVRLQVYFYIKWNNSEKITEKFIPWFLVF